MDSKASKSGFKKDTCESKLLRYLLCHRLSWLLIVVFGLNKIVSCDGLLGRGDLMYFGISISQ